MKPVSVESEEVGISLSVEEQASSGMAVGGISGKGSTLSLGGASFLDKSTKNLIRMSCGFSLRSAAKRSSLARDSLTVELNLEEAASSVEAITSRTMLAPSITQRKIT